VADLQHLYTWVYPTALELPQIRLGDEVSVRVDAFPGRDFPGRVVHVSPEAEFTPKNVQTAEERVRLVYAVKVRVLDDPGHELKPGLPVDVTLALDAAGGAAAGPAAGVEAGASGVGAAAEPAGTGAAAERGGTAAAAPGAPPRG
jgi:hypothetical protein